MLEGVGRFGKATLADMAPAGGADSCPTTDPAAAPRTAARASRMRLVPIRYHAGMPALNVTFTDEEMEAVRASAAAEGKSLKQYLHDLALREQQRAVFVRYAAAFGEQYRGEFDEAFPDEVPPAGTRHGGAAAA